MLVRIGLTCLTVLAVGAAACGPVSSKERISAQEAPAPAKKLWPKGSKEAAKQFGEFMTSKYLPDRIKKWSKDRMIVRETIGAPGVVITATGSAKNEPVRSFYFVETFDKKGGFQARKGDYYPGGGLVLGNAEILNFGKLKPDEASLENLFAYYSDARNDEAGNANVMNFAAWLYENGAVWAGNRALTNLKIRMPALEGEILAEIKARHKFADDAVMVQTKMPGFSNWPELIPESLKEERTKAREAQCETELRLAAARARLSIQTAERVTWEMMTSEVPYTKDVLALSLAQIEREITMAQLFAEGSAAAEKDQKTYEDAKDLKKMPPAVLQTAAYWKAEVTKRMEKAKEVTTVAEKKFGDADALRKKFNEGKDDGKGGDDLEKAYDTYDEAEAEYRKLLPTKESPPGTKALDPFNMRHWAQLAETLRQTCRPHPRQPDKCDKESKVKEAQAAAELVIRAHPRNAPAQVTRGICFMLQKEYGKCREALQKVADDEDHSSAVRKNAADYIKNVVEPVEKTHMEKQKIKKMGKD